MELRKKLSLSKLEVALPNNLLGTGGMIAMSLCLTDLLCFSLQCFHPSGCCDRFTQILEGTAEDTSVRTGGKLNRGSLKTSESIGLWKGAELAGSG